MVAPSNAIIDVDTHVTEDPNLFTDRVSKKWGDLVPHVRYDERAREDSWYIGGEKFTSAWGSASMGWEDRWPERPMVREDVDPASYDANARVALLDRLGFRAQALYPNVAGFGGQRFLDLRAYPELMIACVRAYNDFLADWMSVAPDRFIGIASLPFWDVELSVQEIQRAAEIGHRGILFSGAPHELGFPFLADPHWDRIWAAAQDAGMPISFHLGSGDVTKAFNPERIAVEGFLPTVVRSTTESYCEIGKQLNDLLVSGILPRFPDLKFVMVESGAGIVPFVLESADWQFLRYRMSSQRPYFTDKPSDYFRRQVSVTFWFERIDPDVLERVGVGNVLFETDFPHPSALNADEVREAVSGVMASHGEDAQRLLYGNAAALYRLD
jgi:predicted TIM-barrel fold metal-dependent hydrolase